MTGYPKPITWKSKKYRDYVKTFKCSVWECQRSIVDPHHVRVDCNAGVGGKPSDTWCMPLCREHHDEWDRLGILSFQKKYELNIYRDLFLIAKSYIEANIK